jgi:hypothetical protein
MKNIYLALCVLALSTVVFAGPESLLDETIKKYMSLIPGLKQSIRDKSVRLHSEVVNRIVGNGFTRFKQ